MGNGDKIPDQPGLLGFIKVLVGDVPAPWFRLVVFGALITWAFFYARDFKRAVSAESSAVRQALIESIAANQAWKDATMAERRAYVRKIDRRFEKLYRRNGLEYEPLDDQ